MLFRARACPPTLGRCHRAARPRRGAKAACDGQTEPDDHAIGRSCGGLTTKIHLTCAGYGPSLSVVLWTGGQAHDTDLLAGIRFTL
ncbi:hypothetical protein [Kibdelosporangium aridum]|uniref:hypothetical protein n=1 Tax=Kibdelosporangium aridum TaxID=2030 RepID=UPI00068EA4A2